MFASQESRGSPAARDGVTTTPTGLLRLLALASIFCTFNLPLNGCVEPDDDVIDTTGDDDDASDDADCTLEASTYIEDALISAEKPDGSHVFDDCLAEEVAEEDRNVEDAAYGCSMVAPANISLIISAFAPNAVGCDIPVTLAASATPHEETIPLGYGSETTVAYQLFASDGTAGALLDVETLCETDKVVLHTHGGGQYEVIGDRLEFNGNEMGSVLPDLSEYLFSNGTRLVRQ